jgi:pyruvate,water dikinase
MSSFLGWVKEKFGRTNKASRGALFTELFVLFQKVLTLNNQVLEMIADMGTKLGGNYVFDQQYIRTMCHQLADSMHELIYDLDTMAPRKYIGLYDAFRDINHQIEEELAGRLVIPKTEYTMPYDFISRDFGDVVGAKNANLGEIRNVLGLAAPAGFAITTRAFQCFMENGGLQKRISETIAAWQKGELSSEDAGAKIGKLIRMNPVPAVLVKSIENALNALYSAADAEDKEACLALRSSARGEDTEMSFAGQYVSLLNEPRGAVPEGYKTILAGTYSGSALEYRRLKGFEESEVAMAVGCQLMIDAKASGVLYTLDPQSPEREVMVLTANWGLGAPLVSGEVKADQYAVARKPPYPVMTMDIVRKEKQLSPEAGGGTRLHAVGPDHRARSTLTDSQIGRIAETGLVIERHFKKPQDIEWALDKEDRLFVLQARPLNIKSQVAELVSDISSILKGYPIILEKQGAVAQEGVGTGRVFVVNSEEDLDVFPQGAVLVSRYTSPRFAKVIRKANALVTDIGSPTGHMATIAREFHVPAIVNTGVATQRLLPGQEVTVDARQNVIYEGKVKALCYCEFAEEAFEETYEYRLLRRVLKRIAPLNLLDPSDKDFVPSACKTFHDITRFVHEKAVQQLIKSEYDNLQGLGTAAGKRLRFDVPLSLVLIDIGGGLATAADDDIVEEKDVVSIPMQAFLEGLAVPGAWNTEPVSVDFGGFMSSLTRTFSIGVASPRFVGQNLAIVSKEYANISLRLGYHFNLIDAYASERTEDNYAYFRFLGGVTDIARRSRRARLLGDILAGNDFRTDVRGDLVVARIKRLDVEEMKWALHLLGLLVAYSRQLDIKMISEQEMSKSIEEFNGLKNAHRDLSGH